MTAPSYDSHTTAVNVASDAPIILDLPASDPTGKLMVAIIATRLGGPPPAPSGWDGPFGDGGIYVFTKRGESSDAGGTVGFDAYSSVTTLQTAAVLYVADNAVGIDLLTASSKANGGFANATQGRTTAADTLVLSIFMLSPSASAGAAAAFTFLPATNHVDLSPSGTSKVWLAVSDETRSTAGVTNPEGAIAPGSNVWRAVTLALRGYQPPLAPTLTGPADGAFVDATADLDLTWTYNNVDSDNGQLAYTVALTDLTTSTVTPINAVSSLGETTIDHTDLTAGHDYQWRVETVDQQSETGPYSTARTFTAQAPPAAPTITTPTDGATITVATLPVDLTLPLTTRWWQIRRVADISGTADPSVVYYDSGATKLATTGSPPTFPTSLSRTLILDTTGRHEHVQARVATGTGTAPGLWSTWADAEIDVEFTPPPAPNPLTVGVDALAALMTVNYTTPAATGAQPDATSVDIYVSTDGGATGQRIATGLPTTGTWTFYTPASGINYVFRAVALADDGASATTDWSTAW